MVYFTYEFNCNDDVNSTIRQPQHKIDVQMCTALTIVIVKTTPNFYESRCRVGHSYGRVKFEFNDRCIII